MVSNTVFLNETWIWPILVGAIVLLVAFLLKDWAQAGKHRFFLKSFFALLAVTSLALIALKPAIPSSQGGNYIALLTPGYATKDLDSLKREVRKLKVINYEPGVSLPADVKLAERVYVLGQGIKEYDLWQLAEVHFSYLKSETPRGISKFNYRFENRIGDLLVLKGLYNDPEEGHSLVLEGPGGEAMDSLVLIGERKMPFELKTLLKVSGNYVYAIVEKDSKGRIVNKDLLPIKVLEKDILRILIVNSFPTFETRYLKNYLAEAGHQVIIKNQVTRGRYKFEYFNTERIPIGNLSGALLEPFDLLIADASSLRGFSGSEIKAVQNEVEENGLGLFIQPDDSYFNSRGELYPLNFERIQGSEITIQEWPAIKLNGFPFRIKKEFGVTGIHTSGNSMVAAYKTHGEGRIGTGMFWDTWHLVLEGKDEIYKDLWTPLIEKLSKKEVSQANWNTAETIVQRNEPYEFEIRTETEDPIVKTGSGNHIPLMQDPGLPYLWKGITWPRETGWNSLELDSISTYDFYVEDNSSLNAITAAQTMQANERFSITSERGKKELGAIEPINPLWFFGLFLLCMGGLWLEPKI